MRKRIGDALDVLLNVVLVLMVVTAAGLLMAVILNAVDCGPDLHSTWPESAEFSQLMTGQERFSEHSTNVPGLRVLVDHATGAQYVVTSHGVCPLLGADGTPLLVAEAGE